MAFKPLRYDEGKVAFIKLVTSAAVARFDALADDGNGLYQRSTSSTTSVQYVSLEDVASASAAQEIRALPTRGVLFIADTATDPVQTDVGTTADLTDHDTLNESAATNDVFLIEEIEGAATERKVRGYFITDKATA